MRLLTGLGVTVGFHRLFTHRSFKARPAVRAVLAVLAFAAIEGPVISWVADHRKHHAFCDRPGDPHSPHVDHGGGWRGAVRLFVLHHMTYSINSICHVFGRRTFATTDESRSVFWLALPTFGEAWHNNHHAFQPPHDTGGALAARPVGAGDPWPRGLRLGHSRVAIITGLTLLVTGDFMLRSRVIQALELAAGPDWQAVARPVG